MKLLLCFSLALAVRGQDIGLSLDSPRTTLDVGRGLMLRASLNAAPGVNARLAYSSSNPNIASVSADGEVRGLFPGVTTIRVREMATETSAEIEMKVIPARIRLAWSREDMRVGDSAQFSAEAFDADGQPIRGVAFSFTSSQPHILEVSGEGIARGLEEGAVTVTAQVQSAPASIVFQSSIGIRVGPRREYALRRLLISDPASGAVTITGFTDLSTSGDFLGGVATLSNGGQAAVVRDPAGALRVAAFAGQYLPNIGRLAMRITGFTVNARGDALISVQYPNPWCENGLVLLPRSGPETEVAVNGGCNSSVNKHALADDGSVYFVNSQTQLIRRLPDGTERKLLTREEHGVRWFNSVAAARNGNAALVWLTDNSGAQVLYHVTEKSLRKIYAPGQLVSGRNLNGNFSQWHGDADGNFYAVCWGHDFAAVCRASANGMEIALSSGAATSDGARIQWIHNVFDAGGGRLLFSGDVTQAGSDNAAPHLATLEGNRLTRLFALKQWNGVIDAQFLGNAVMAAFTDSDALLQSVRSGSEPSVILAARTPLAVRAPPVFDLQYAASAGAGSSLIALGAGHQLLQWDAGGVREILSPGTRLPDGGRMMATGSLATSRSGRAALTMNTTNGSGVYRVADGKLSPLLTANGPVAGPDSNRFSWSHAGWRGYIIGINSNGDVATHAVFGPFERLVFIPNGATQAKAIFTSGQVLPNGVILANPSAVAVDDLGRVAFLADIVSAGQQGLFLWDGQQITELTRNGAQLDGRVVNGFHTITAGPKSFAAMIGSQDGWRLYTFSDRNLKLELSGERALPGFPGGWMNYYGQLSMSGNGDLQLLAGGGGVPGIVALRPSGSSALLIRTGDSLTEGGFVIQPLGFSTGPNGEMFMLLHILEDGVEKVAVYLATPQR